MFCVQCYLNSSRDFNARFAWNYEYSASIATILNSTSSMLNIIINCLLIVISLNFYAPPYALKMLYFHSLLLPLNSFEEGQNRFQLDISGVVHHNLFLILALSSKCTIQDYKILWYEMRRAKISEDMKWWWWWIENLAGML